MKKEIETILEEMHFVQWDRFCGEIDNDETVQIYGWIEREDSYKDFVVLEHSGCHISCITSSKKYSQEIARIVTGSADNHEDCKRVEHHFNVKNSIKI